MASRGNLTPEVYKCTHLTCKLCHAVQIVFTRLLKKVNGTFLYFNSCFFQRVSKLLKTLNEDVLWACEAVTQNNITVTQ